MSVRRSASDGELSKSSDHSQPEKGFYLPSLWSSSSNSSDRRRTVDSPWLNSKSGQDKQFGGLAAQCNPNNASATHTDSSWASQSYQYQKLTSTSSSSSLRQQQIWEQKPLDIFHRPDKVASEVPLPSFVGPLFNSSDSLKVVHATDKKVKMPMDRDQLKKHMRRRAAEHGDKRLCNALQAIVELPEQVGEVLQQPLTDLLDDVGNEVSKARQLLAAKIEDPQTSTKVATQVQEIPDMVMASFEVSIAKAIDDVRGRVQDVIQVLEEGGMEHDDVVQRLWAIPEEVRQITRRAVKEASEASQDKVLEQLDHVLNNISEEKKTDALFMARQNIVAALPQALPETIRRIAEVTDENVRQATEVVAEKGMGDCGYVANRVVADTLLRAKVEVGETLEGAVPHSPGSAGHPEKEFVPENLGSEPDIGDMLYVPELPQNPGSHGHPEMCSRVCLYFPLGNCTNGSNCGFCHAQHSARSTHLDKRHRELLKSMNFTERLHLILPILKTKFESMSPSRLDLCALLSSISERLENGDGTLDKKRAKNKLNVALKFMSARSLAALLYRSAAPSEVEAAHYQELEEFFNKVWNTSSEDETPMIIEQLSL